MSERDKRLLLITAGILVVGVIYIGSHLVSAQIEDSTVSEQTEKRLEDLFAKMSNVETQKSRNLLLRKKIGNEQGGFVGEKEISKLLAEIEQISGQSGIRVKGYSPTVNPRSRPFPTVEIKVSIECRFEQLISFFDNLKKSKILIQAGSLKAGLKDQNNPDLEAQVTLTSYLIDSKPVPVTPATATAGAPS